MHTRTDLISSQSCEVKRGIDRRQLVALVLSSAARLFAIDRLFWIWLHRPCPFCVNAMVLVAPATVVRSHRKGFRLFWRWRSRPGRPSVDREIRNLIRQMNAANPLWGAHRIHRESLKLC
jgi:putative transposase